VRSRQARRVALKAMLTCSVVTVAFTLANGQSAPPPVNDAPNPYRTVENWAQLPAGRMWGSTSAVEIAKDG